MDESHECNQSILTLRRRSILCIERQLKHLSSKTQQEMDDMLSQLSGEMNDLIRDYESDREGIQASASIDISQLSSIFNKQNKTLSEQKELQAAHHEDEEIEEIIALLKCNLNTISEKIERRKKEMEKQLESCKMRFNEDEKNIKARENESTLKFKQKSQDQYQYLQNCLQEEKKLLAVEEAYWDRKPLHSSTTCCETVGNSKHRTRQGNGSCMSPMLASKLQFATNLNGYSESDSDESIS